MPGRAALPAPGRSGPVQRIRERLLSGRRSNPSWPTQGCWLSVLVYCGRGHPWRGHGPRSGRPLCYACQIDRNLGSTSRPAAPATTDGHHRPPRRRSSTARLEDSGRLAEVLIEHGEADELAGPSSTASIACTTASPACDPQMEQALHQELAEAFDFEDLGGGPARFTIPRACEPDTVLELPGLAELVGGPGGLRGGEPVVAAAAGQESPERLRPGCRAIRSRRRATPPGERREGDRLGRRIRALEFRLESLRAAQAARRRKAVAPGPTPGAWRSRSPRPERAKGSETRDSGRAAIERVARADRCRPPRPGAALPQQAGLRPARQGRDHPVAGRGPSLRRSGGGGEAGPVPWRACYRTRAVARVGIPIRASSGAEAWRAPRVPGSWRQGQSSSRQHRPMGRVSGALTATVPQRPARPARANISSSRAGRREQIQSPRPAARPPPSPGAAPPRGRSPRRPPGPSASASVARPSLPPNGLDRNGRTE